MLTCELEQHPLLQKILELTQAGSDFLSEEVDGRYFKRGVSYYRGNQIADLKWVENRTKLEVHVWGTDLYRLRFWFAKNQEFRMACDCPLDGDESFACKHLICALLSIRELLDEPFGGHFWLKPQLRGRLKARLLEPEKHSSEPSRASTVPPPPASAMKGLEIHLLGPAYAGVTAEFRWAGKPLSPSSSRIPQMLRGRSYGYGYSLQTEIYENRLIEFFKKIKDPYEIFIHTQGKVSKALWAPEKTISARWRMNIRGPQIEFQRLALQKEGAKLESFIRLSENLYFSPQDGVIGKIKGRRRWHFVDLIRKDFFEDDFFEAPYLRTSGFPLSGTISREFKDSAAVFAVERQDFSEALPLFSEIQKEAFLNEGQIEVEGQPAVIAEIEAGYEVHFFHTQAPAFMRLELRATLASGDSTVVSAACFEPFLSVEERRWLGKTARNDILRALFQTLLDWDGESLAVFQKCFEKRIAEYHRTAHLGFEAKAYLTSLLQFLSKGLLRQQLVPFEDGWKWISFDMVKLFRIFGTAYLLFGKSLGQYFRNPTQPLQVKTKDFSRQLQALHILFSQHQTKLFVERKQTEMVSVSLSLQVEESGEDWFELHPEVKVGDRLLSWEEWKKLLAESQGQGLVSNGMIQILDSNAAALAGRFSHLLDFSAGTKPGSAAAEVVKIPRLQILDWIALQKSGIGLRLPPRATELVERLLHFEKVESKKIPEGFQGKLRDYQVKGYEWLAFHYEHQFGACLADDMGLGKTIQAIAFLGALKEGLVSSRKNAAGKPHLLVVPPTLLFNWQQEIQKFYPDLKVEIYAGAQRDWNPEGKDIVLTSYDLVRLDFEKLSKASFHVIVFDEAQMIKNIHAQRAKSVRRLQGDFKICLTGTPFENHLGEYYSVMDLCVPGLLGSYETFKNQLGQKDMQNTLIHRTRPFVLRRTKEKILTELPPKIESEIYLDLSDKQKALYAKMVQEVRPLVEQAYAEKTQAQARIIFLTALLRLRQICVAPQLMVPSFRERSPKVEYLLSKLEELREEGHACLVFSQFAKFLNLVEQELQKEKISYLHMDGTTPMKKRQEIVAQFQDPQGPPVFLVSLKTGGLGLNLTRASYVFHLDPWWNPAVDRQASDRVHRIGQSKTVFIQRILMRHSVEEKVMALRQSKQELFRKIMEDGLQADPGITLTRKDIEYLLA